MTSVVNHPVAVRAQDYTLLHFFPYAFQLPSTHASPVGLLGGLHPVVEVEYNRVLVVVL
jgi:hypothetical protein